MSGQIRDDGDEHVRRLMQLQHNTGEPGLLHEPVRFRRSEVHQLESGANLPEFV